MRNDFDAIPEAADWRSAAGAFTRVYHDIGLAAVADALDLMTAEFSLDMRDSLERGAFYLGPGSPDSGRADMAARN
jgi:hypothetical protein